MALRWSSATRGVRRSFDEAMQSGAALAVTDRSGALIGIPLSPQRPDDVRVEIGRTFLARSHRARGTNRELKQIMLAHVPNGQLSLAYTIRRSAPSAVPRDRRDSPRRR